MPEYGIDAIFALYESKCILVWVALRPQVKAEIVCQNKFYKYHALRHEWGTVTYRTNKNVDIYHTFVLKYKMKKCVERKR